MDDFLIRYLNSGKAWVLVGSGLSTSVGYPSWKQLALKIKETAHVETRAKDLRVLDKAFDARDFPTVFGEASSLLGLPRVRQCLNDILVPSKDSGVYALIARWPIPVYLTTNYDDEIQKHLVRLGEAYFPYSNSEDHLGHLVPDVSGIILKLHGDLRSDKGLILTKQSYGAIAASAEWAYWRTKMTSVFQMVPVIIIGHSLNDPHIRHVLEAAKQGAGVHQPVCWIAPNVTTDQAQTFLEKYRIRIISYQDGDGQHQNLVRLIETITNFLPARITVHIRQEIGQVLTSPLGQNAAAPGFYVFNTLGQHSDFDEKRVDIVVAAVQAVLPKLAPMPEFGFEEALTTAGWPQELPIEASFEKAILERLFERKVFARSGEGMKVVPEAENQSKAHRLAFERMRDRFKESVKLRIRRKYSGLSEGGAVDIASDIESALTGYFREGGLTLATVLFAANSSGRPIVPNSILKFISDASAKYDDLLSRQVFMTGSVDAFIEGEAAEREYLGRIAQGFFSFHALGVFGDAARERLDHAKDTVWLIDSDAQIPAVALGAPASFAFRSCFQRLKSAGIRLVSTEKLFWETHTHIWFADNVVKGHGIDSPMIIAAATGQTPYYKSNQFLEGFIKWQEAGNPRDWSAYLYALFGHTSCKPEYVRKALQDIGIEIVAFDIWPGFEQTDHDLAAEYTQKIAEMRRRHPVAEDVLWEDMRKKAEPEAESFVIVKKERDGKYHMLKEGNSSAWFVSHTSILNGLEPPLRVTWQPEAFLGFTSTLGTATAKTTADETFQTLLWGLAQSGMTLLDEKAIAKVFGGIIDQATVDIGQQREIYEKTLAEKYGEPVSCVMERIRPIDRPLAAFQIASEIAQVEEDRRMKAEHKADEADKRAKSLQKKLDEVERYRKRMEAKKGKKKTKKKKV